ncbi:hypothetical protein JCM5353_008516 [Sporobolomyces roseus]
MTTPFAPSPEATLLRRLSSISHLLLVLSGKGGVGKSSVSVQLALSLLASDPSLKIGLLDVDLTGPSLPRMLGLQGQSVHSSQDGWVPVYLDARVGGQRGGVLSCMSIGFLLKDSSESVVWRGPKKNAMIKQFLGQVRWGELDYLIVDTPPGTSDEHISLLETLRPLLVDRPSPSPPLPTLSSLLVSTPQALALLDVSKELSFVRRTKLPLLGLIENMSGYVCPHCGDVVGVFGQGGGQDFCRIQEEKKDSLVEGEGGGCRFLGRIPIDRELVALLDDVAGNSSGEGKVKVLGEEEAERIRSGAGIEEVEKEKKTLVERYREIPSFKVVEGVAKEVRRLIEEQAKEEEEKRRTTTV